MRNILILFSFVLFFGAIYHKEHHRVHHNEYQKIHSDLSQPPSERQVSYRIGTIDPRFKLSEDEAKELVRGAASIWEQPLGHQFFFYNPSSEFTINFIYDQRQETTNARQRAERVLADGQDHHKVASNDFYQQKSSLDEEFHRHADELSTLNERMSQHQQNVDLLNARGGATKNEVQSMQAESDLIDRDVAMYNQYSTSLDAKQVNLQHQAQNIQSQVDVYNQQTRTYNQIFTGHSFEAGRYNGDMINIYDFDNKDNLRLILAHELGHALGLEHTNDPLSLMYPTLEKQDMAHFKLTQSDIDLLYGRGR